MGGNLLISPADFRRAEDIANIKMGTFISVPLVSSHFLLHHFLIILSTGQFIFAHFPKLPTDLLIMSQVPGFDFQDSLKSGFQNFTKHPLYPWIGYCNSAKQNCLKSSPLLLSSPLQIYAYVLSSSCVVTLLKLHLYVNSWMKHSLLMPAGWSFFIL